MIRFRFTLLIFFVAISFARADEGWKAKQFPKDLAIHFRNLFTFDNLAPVLIGSTSTVIAYQFDESLMEYFTEQDRLGSADEAAEVMAGEYVVSGTAGMLFLFGQLSENMRFREMTYSLAQGIVLNGGITLATKSISGRLRPDITDSFSFPSGHTSNAFTIATVLTRFYGARAGIPAYAAAAFIGASRVTKNSHYLSDVLAGATLGYIVGRTVSRTNNIPAQHFYFTPCFSPSKDGVGLAIEFHF